MLVLLDRDGVINADTPSGITCASQLRLIAGSAEAIAQLNAAGLKVAVITNQSVVGKGLMSEAQLEDIHAALRAMLASVGARLDAILWCGDAPDNLTSTRRKPAAGMLLEALAMFGASAAHTPMVGDDLRDMQAAFAAGCPRHLVQTGKGQAAQGNALMMPLAPVQTHADLAAFATYWLHQTPKLA